MSEKPSTLSPGHERQVAEGSRRKWDGWPFRAVLVSGDSMAPGLRSGDRLLVRLGARARVGDVVVAGRPDRPELLLLKRVVRIERDRLWLHGDNPEASDDSRLFGAVETWDVFGRVVLRYWPVRRRAS